jgi:hypothetical protein
MRVTVNAGDVLLMGFLLLFPGKAFSQPVEPVAVVELGAAATASLGLMGGLLIAIQKPHKTH